MKIILILLILLVPGVILAQSDTLVWKPISTTDPIYNLKVSCDSETNLVFDGVYKDAKGIKAAYVNEKGHKSFVYRNQMTYVNYNIEVWSDSIITIYYDHSNGNKCTLIFRVKSTPEELRKLFEGIPGHKGF